LSDSFRIGATAKTYVNSVVNFEDIATVECSGFADAGNRMAEFDNNFFNVNDLGFALVTSRSGDDGRAFVHDDSIFNKYAVGAIISGWNFDDLPLAKS